MSATFETCPTLKCNITAFSPFILKEFFFLQKCILRSNTASLCPNMINFDALDFSVAPKKC